MIAPENDYYTSRENLLQMFDAHARQYAFNSQSISEFTVWKKEVRGILTRITGLDTMERCDLQPKRLESVQMTGYRRDKMIIQTEQNVWMPFYLLIPDGVTPDDKRASIIAAHGHGSCGKEAIAGRADFPLLDRMSHARNSAYGLDLVREGYIVLCPDARGAGQRREWMDQGDDEAKLRSSSCNDLNNALISLGRSLTGVQVWDLMRLIDYIEGNPLCNANYIGCCGMSGGGCQTIWLTALDERIRCGYVSGYFHGYRDTLLAHHRCGCNFVPHLWETIDMGDLGALVAPTPLLIETGVNDPLNGLRGVVDVNEQLEITQRAFALFGATDRLYHHLFNGVHEWNGGKLSEFFKKWLR